MYNINHRRDRYIHARRIKAATDLNVSSLFVFAVGNCRNPISQFQRPIRIPWHWILSCIPEWRDLEELFPSTLYQCRTLVGKVHKLLNSEAMRKVVGEHGRIGGLRLSHQAHGAWVIQEQIMHLAAPPGHSSMRAPETHVTDQGMTPPIPVASIEVGSKMILLQ